jgi:hypothetical protein
VRVPSPSWAVAAARNVMPVWAASSGAIARRALTPELTAAVLAMQRDFMQEIIPERYGFSN